MRWIRRPQLTKVVRVIRGPIPKQRTHSLIGDLVQNNTRLRLPFLRCKSSNKAQKRRKIELSVYRKDAQELEDRERSKTEGRGRNRVDGEADPEGKVGYEEERQKASALRPSLQSSHSSSQTTKKNS
eukprot:c25684_g2_i2 orf=563-943(+)